MARRQNEDVGPAGLIFLAVAIFGALILTAAVYLPPTALLIALLYFELRAPFTSKDFALTGEEKIRLSKFDCYRNAIGINFQRVKEEGSDLKQNRDGSFHRGSKLGMQLNNKLEELQAVQDELDRRTHAIARRSRTTFDRWSRIKSFQFALRCTVVGYVLSIVILYLLDPVFVDSFSQFVGHHVLMRISGVDNAIYGSILISSIGAGILVWPIYKLRRSALERNAEALGVSTDYFPDEMEHVTSNPAIDWDQYFEAILDAATRYRNGTYYNNDATGSNEEWKEENTEPEEEAWYETLGISPAASRREIDEAWRLKMKKNHPDRVAELDPEFRALAEERTKRLNAARQEGLHQRKQAG